MSKLIRRGKNPDKYKDLLVLVWTKIVKIEEKNKEFPESKKRYKNVFYCESTKNDTLIMCIYWGYATIATGDEVVLKGRKIDEDKFLCREIQILRSA